LDLMRCESVALRTYWELVVMDQCTRRIIGFGIQAGDVDGLALCRMLKQAVRGVTGLPKYLSSDHDPLYRFHKWEANLRVPSGQEIKTVPHVPLSQAEVSHCTSSAAIVDTLLFTQVVSLAGVLLGKSAVGASNRQSPLSL